MSSHSMKSNEYKFKFKDLKSGFLSQESYENCHTLHLKNELKFMLKNQTKNRFYNQNLDSKANRVFIILKTLQPLSELLEVNKITFYTSISLFDVIISNFKLTLDEMNITAIICFELSMKLNENRPKSLSFSDISTFIIRVDKLILREYEETILKKLNYEINIKSPSHFLFFFMDLSFLNFNSISQNIINELLNITLLDYTFNKFTSCVVALSIITFSRKLTNETNPFPLELEKMVDYTIEDISICLELLEMRFKERFVNKCFKLTGILNSEINDNRIDLKKNSNLNLKKSLFHTKSANKNKITNENLSDKNKF